MSLYKKMLGFAALMLVFTVAVAFFAATERRAMKESSDAHTLQILIYKAEEHKTLFLFRRNVRDAQEAARCLSECQQIVQPYQNEAQTATLAEEIRAYHNVLSHLLPQMIERGLNENSGAEGALRASVHEIELIIKATKLDRLEADVLSARRSEKDFFMRRNRSYIEKTYEAIAALKRHSAASALPAATKERIVQLADNYLSNFDRASSLTNEMQIVSDTLSRRFGSMITLTDDIVRTKVQQAQATEQRMIVFLGVAFVLSIGIAFWLANKLASPIIRLKNAANELAVGEYVGEVRVHTQDEVQELAAAFNFMVKRIRERTMALQQSNLELREANRHIYHQNRILAEQASEIELFNTELQEKNERLKELDHIKNEFLGIAAHDLKNPLSGIRMLSKILHDQSERMEAQEIREMSSEIISSSSRMFELITTLLDVNALETGGVVVRWREFDIHDALAAVVEEYRERAAAKSISLVHTPPIEPLVVRADMNITRQIIENLLSNAVKYSPYGKRVYVAAMHFGNHALMSIRDEGPGLTEEDKAHLFGKFARLSARPTGGEHSTGLGLSIVKTLAEKISGHVYCESVYGAGATFFVELLLAHVPELAQHPLSISSVSLS